MRLVLPRGIARARLFVRRSAHALIAVYCGSGPVPELTLRGDETELVFMPSVLDRLLAAVGKGRDVDVVLHAGVAWDLAFREGTASLVADFTEGALSSLDVTGGASNVSLLLPRPTQNVQVRIGGGVKSLRLERPADVRVAVAIRGGVTSLALDDRAFFDMGGPLRLTAAGARSFDPGYQLAIAGGAVGVEVVPAHDGVRSLP
jgi:hypothetical protein